MALGGVVDKFIGAIRAAFGLDPDPGTPPDILHLGLYPSRVDLCATDGSTCDVTPADSRISARKNVRVRAGVPGAVAIVQPGAIVCLAFEGGDPGQPFIDPSWTQGATVSKLTLNALALELAGNTYSAPQWDPFIAALKAFIHTTAGLGTVATLLQVATALNAIITAAGTLDGAIGAANSYKSTKVKNG